MKLTFANDEHIRENIATLHDEKKYGGRNAPTFYTATFMSGVSEKASRVELDDDMLVLDTPIDTARYRLTELDTLTVYW